MPSTAARSRLVGALVLAGAASLAACTIPNPQHVPPGDGEAPLPPDLRRADVPPPDLDATDWLSDHPFTSAQNGSGPVERDRSNGGNLSGDGGPLRIAGATWARGLGTSAAADVRFALSRAYRSFACDIGIDDETGGQGSAVFQLFVDGRKAFDSGLLRGGQAARPVSISLVGVDELRLVLLDGGDGSAGDHGDWAGARLVR